MSDEIADESHGDEDLSERVRLVVHSQRNSVHSQAKSTEDFVDTEEMVFVAGYLGVAGRYREQIEIIRPAVARRPPYVALCML